LNPHSLKYNESKRSTLKKKKKKEKNNKWGGEGSTLEAVASILELSGGVNLDWFKFVFVGSVLELDFKQPS